MHENLFSISSFRDNGAMARTAFSDALLCACLAIISRSLLNSRELREVWGIIGHIEHNYTRFTRLSYYYVCPQKCADNKIWQANHQWVSRISSHPSTISISSGVNHSGLYTTLPIFCSRMDVFNHFVSHKKFRDSIAAKRRKNNPTCFLL